MGLINVDCPHRIKTHSSKIYIYICIQFVPKEKQIVHCVNTKTDTVHIYVQYRKDRRKVMYSFRTIRRLGLASCPHRRFDRKSKTEGSPLQINSNQTLDLILNGTMGVTIMTVIASYRWRTFWPHGGVAVALSFDTKGANIQVLCVGLEFFCRYLRCSSAIFLQIKVRAWMMNTHAKKKHCTILPTSVTLDQ